MKPIKVIFLSISAFFIFFIAGCGSPEDGIVGYWKSVNEKTYIGYNKVQTYVITKKSVEIDGKTGRDDMIWEEKDGKIFGKSEKSPFENIEIQIIAEDKIAIWRRNPHTSPNADGDVFVRTTKEDVEALIKSPGTQHERIGW